MPTVKGASVITHHPQNPDPRTNAVGSVDAQQKKATPSSTLSTQDGGRRAKGDRARALHPQKGIEAGKRVDQTSNASPTERPKPEISARAALLELASIIMRMNKKNISSQDELLNLLCWEISKASNPDELIKELKKLIDENALGTFAKELYDSPNRPDLMKQFVHVEHVSPQPAVLAY